MTENKWHQRIKTVIGNELGDFDIVSNDVIRTVGKYNIIFCKQEDLETKDGENYVINSHTFSCNKVGSNFIITTPLITKNDIHRALGSIRALMMNKGSKLSKTSKMLVESLAKSAEVNTYDQVTTKFLLQFFAGEVPSVPNVSDAELALLSLGNNSYMKMVVKKLNSE
jgi:hypothetical protein